MNLRTGVDLVAVGAIERLLGSEGETFIASVWTPGEQRYCASRPERMATRFAAKEATLKALGLGVGSIPLTDIEVANDDTGVPRLQLHDEAAAASDDAGLTEWSVSLSHEAGIAVAFVVAW